MLQLSFNGFKGGGEAERYGVEKGGTQNIVLLMVPTVVQKSARMPKVAF